jgi:phospholipid transport system substrate-binding protein
MEVTMQRLMSVLPGLLLASAVWLAPAPALAGPLPDELVKSVANDVLAVIREDKALKAGDTSRMAQLIEEKIAPHFDFERMTRLAVGRSWRQASAEQQAQLVREFRTLLVRSYSNAYSAYNHIVVDVKPLKLQPGDDDVQVRTQIRLPGGAPPINVDYSMVKNSEDWKVYDVTVDGVSLVTTYRTTFAEEVSKGGIDGLLASLTALNSAKPAAQRPAGAPRRQ